MCTDNSKGATKYVNVHLNLQGVCVVVWVSTYFLGFCAFVCLCPPGASTLANPLLLFVVVRPVSSLDA